MNWSFRKKGSSTTKCIIPVQVHQETRQVRVNSASKWYHEVVETIVSILDTSWFVVNSLFFTVLPVFFIVDQIIHLFVRKITYDIGPVVRRFAVIFCVFWATFLWSAFDAGFLNLILETIWKSKIDPHGQIDSFMMVIFTGLIFIYAVGIISWVSWPLMTRTENFQLIGSFLIIAWVFVILPHDLYYDDFIMYSDSVKEGLKWTSTASFFLMIYSFITLFTFMMVSFLKYIERIVLCAKRNNVKGFTYFWNSEILYWVNGLKDSIDYILGSLLLLFAWEPFCLPFFPRPERIKDFGYWTCVSLFIWSILWLIKTYIILLWEAQSISKYGHRLRSKIQNGSKQLYFLTIFVAYYNPSGCPFHSIRHKMKVQYIDFNVQNNKFTMYGIQQLVKQLLKYKNFFRKRNVISIFIDQLTESIRNIEVPCEKDETKKINRYLTQIISKDDLLYFNKQLEKDGFGDTKHPNITLQGLQNWMEKARNNYLHIANTLSGQQEIVDCLDKIMTLVVLLLGIVIWLHLTGSSTTNVILAIISPFVIGNFMFREIWKAMITGIMFVYFMHPFDVGDLCIVDDEMMEVKSVGVWRTTFAKVDTQAEVSYSNSDLSNKKIIYHNIHFDWNDYKELNVGSLKAEKVENLKIQIERYLNDKSKFTKSSVEVLTTGNDIKIAAKFRHNPKYTNLTCSNSYYECLNKKCQLRSEFVLDVQRFLDEHNDPPNVKTADEFLYKEHVPAIMMKYLDKWINVKGDGNCGFRCVSHAYQGDQEQWSFIRKELLIEIKGHRETYKSIYGHLQDGSSEKDEIVDSAINRIDKPDQGPAIEEKWMDSDDLYAVATRFNYAVIFFVKYETETDKNKGLIGCTTILPLRAEVGVTKPEAELAIVHVRNNHYIRLIMKENHPLPPIDNRWSEYKDNSVKDWDTIYTDRLNRWNKEASI